MIFLLFSVTVIGLNGQGEVIEAIVVVVNDDIITLSEYRQAYEFRYRAMRDQFQGEEFDKQLQLMREGLLDELITDLLLIQEAKRENIDVSEQVNTFIENLKRENNIETDEQLQRAMRQQGIDFATFRKNTEERFLKQGILFSEVGRHIVVDDSSVVGYYQQHPDEFTDPPEFTLKAIYLSTEGRSEEEIETRMKEISSKLEVGEDFGVLAGQYSEGPEKESAGDLGNFKKGELDKALEQAVEAIEKGGISSWVQTRNGWYLLMVVDKKSSRLRAFEECRKEIEQKLFEEMNQERITEYLNRLKEKNYIKILISDPLDFNDRGEGTT